MAVSLNVQETLLGTLGIVNHADGTPIPATFANAAFTSSDPTIFTAAADSADAEEVDIVGVAVGTATLSVSADCTYNDPATQQPVTVNKTATISVTISPAATATDLVVTFGTPTPAAS